MATSESYDIVICGSGFSGIGMGIRLLQNGITNFIILEKSASVGGTWRDNTYPGAACDVMSHLYSFSFYQNPTWTMTYSGWDEIRAYMESAVDAFSLRPYIRFSCDVERAIFREGSGKKNVWDIEVKHVSGKTSMESTTIISCQYFISAAGVFSRISVPNFKGKDTFSGPQFHTGRWDHSIDLKGKRVAIVGTGASAIQVIPEIATIAKEVVVFQRSAAWVLPKTIYAYSSWYKSLLRVCPPLLWFSRLAVYLRHEIVTNLFVSFPKILRLAESATKAEITRHVHDPEKQRLLVPQYSMGCKRILLSNDYYPSMAKDHVSIIPQTIDHIDKDGIVTIDGTLHPVDAIVYATGFQITDCSGMHSVIGPNGTDLRDLWTDRSEVAFLGTFVRGYPNFFVLLGPNSGLGTNSVVYMIECQINMIIRCLGMASSKQAATIEVRQDVQDGFNKRLQSALSGSLWLSGCRSWYLDKNGTNTTMWPYTTFRYWMETILVRSNAFEFK